jgi:hypothetical protein
MAFGRGKKKKQKERKPPGKLKAALGRSVFKIGFLRRRYLKTMLEQLEDSKPHQLTPEMRQIQIALKRVPKGQRMATLETALRHGLSGEQPASNRTLRRQAGRKGGPPPQYKRR